MSRERDAADLARELIAADRPSKSVAEEPAPIGHALDPVGLLLYPVLRRNRKVLLPVILIVMTGLLLLSALT
jgi:hypothetical protein